MTTTLTTTRRTAAVAAVGALLAPSGSRPARLALPPRCRASAAPSTLTGTVTFWHFFTDREAARHPGGRRRSRPPTRREGRRESGQDDEKTIQAIAAGQPIDVVLSYSTDQIGKFCSTGAWQDLGPYVERDGVDLNNIPAVPDRSSTASAARCRCSADTYGLYYNKKLLADAGLQRPPNDDRARRDGGEGHGRWRRRRDQGAGFVRRSGSTRTRPAHFRAVRRRHVVRRRRRSHLATDPAGPRC